MNELEVKEIIRQYNYNKNKKWRTENKDYINFYEKWRRRGVKVNKRDYEEYLKQQEK